MALLLASSGLDLPSRKQYIQNILQKCYPGACTSYTMAHLPQKLEPAPCVWGNDNVQVRGSSDPSSHGEHQKCGFVWVALVIGGTGPERGEGLESAAKVLLLFFDYSLHITSVACLDRTDGP